MTASRTNQISAIAALNDPQRRSLYEFVRESSGPVSRDEAAGALELPRSTVAFHLDRLVEEGVLETEFKRLSGKTGPGSGRPAKLYRVVPRDISVSIPPRQYEFAAGLLASAVEHADRTGESVRDALTIVATKTGRELGERAGGLHAALTSCGYEPRDDGSGGLVLTNCPFDRLAAKHSEIICRANVALLSSVAEATGQDGRRVEFAAPADGRCCVRVTPSPPRLPNNAEHG